MQLRYRAITPSSVAARTSESARRRARSGSIPEPARWDVSEKNAAQLRFRMLKAQFVRAGSHDHHDVGAWLQLCTMQSKNFSHEPFCPVPLDRSPDLATRRNSEAGLTGLAGALEHQKMPARLAVSSALDSKEIPARSDAARPCQPKVRTTGARAWAESSPRRACVPWRDGAKGPPPRSWSSCGTGIRGSSTACGGSVEMCASA